MALSKALAVVGRLVTGGLGPIYRWLGAQNFSAPAERYVPPSISSLGQTSNSRACPTGPASRTGNICSKDALAVFVLVHAVASSGR